MNKSKHAINWWLEDGGGYSAAVTTALANIQARGGTLPTGTALDAYVAFIDGMVAINEWSNNLACYILKSTDSISALTNLITNDFHGSVTGSATFSNNGMLTTGAGASNYVQLDLNLSTDGGSIYTLNNAKFVIGATSDSTITSFLVSQSASVTVFGSLFNSGTMYFQTQLNDTSTRNVNTGLASVNGCLMHDRVGSTDSKTYYQGSQIGTSAAASTSLSNSNVRLVCNGSGNDYFKVFIIGASSRSNASAISTLVNTLMNAY